MEKLITFLLIGVSFAETTEFMVSFMGFDAAKVTITVKETKFNDKDAESIIYITETVSGAKSLFPVDNFYKTIINPNSRTILYFEKSTSQPWLKNNLKTTHVDEKVFYSNSLIEIPKSYQNIFTLLQLVNHLKVEKLLKEQFYIDREGQRYIANFISGKPNDQYRELLLNLELIEDDVNPVIENTDIFTWAVFRDGAERILGIKAGKLVYCEFSFGFVTMRAKIVEK